MIIIVIIGSTDQNLKAALFIRVFLKDYNLRSAFHGLLELSALLSLLLLLYLLPFYECGSSQPRHGVFLMQWHGKSPGIVFLLSLI